jgi:hypothetical protein
MTKSAIALATASLVATALLTSTAEAGMKVRLGFGYPLGSFTAHGNSSGKSGGSYHKPRRAKRHQVRRSDDDDVQVSKKPSAAKPVAKAEPDTAAKPVEKAATSENSSISTAEAKPDVHTDSTETGSAVEAPAAKKTDCKQFFPSVGMTLTVPCE